MAGEQVTISVTYEGSERTIPLAVKPSIELSDEQVELADGELRGLLRQTFQLPPDSRCFLYEAVSRRSLSAESFRDPNNLPVFPHRWILTVEPSSCLPTLKYGQQSSLLAHNDFMYNSTFARDSSPLPTLEDLSLLPHTNHHSTITLHCGDQGEFGLTLRHFTIRPNIPESPNTPEDMTHLDSVGSNDSVESLCLSTLFVYRLEPGGPAERASLKEGDVVLKINGCSMTRCTTADVQAILQKCGKRLTLVVSPKECDDLQFLYPSHTSGDPGEQTTHDGVVICYDIVVMAANGGEAISSGSSIGELLASGSLPSLDDPRDISRIDGVNSPTNFPAHSRQDSLDVFSDTRFQMARSPINFSILGSHSPPLPHIENGFVDWPTTLRNLDEMTSTESLEKLAASINPEMSPSWSQFMEENGFPSQVRVHVDENWRVDLAGTKSEGAESGGGMAPHEDESALGGAVRQVPNMQSHESATSGGSAYPSSSYSAADSVHTGGNQKDSSGHRTSRKGTSSLVTLTQLAGNRAEGGGERDGVSHPEDGGGYTSKTRPSPSAQDTWISRSSSPSKSDSSLHSQQSVSQHCSQERRLSGGDDGGGGSQNSEVRNKRANRSYQSQRAQLHKALGARQSAEGDHPRSSAHVERPSSAGKKPHISRRGHSGSSHSPINTFVPTGNLTQEEGRHSQDPVLTVDAEEVTQQGGGFHQRVPSNEERHTLSGGGHSQASKVTRRPASAKVLPTTHVSIDEAIEKASQPGRSFSVDGGVMYNGLGTKYEPTLEEVPIAETSPRRAGSRKLFPVHSVDYSESSASTMPTIQGVLKKEKDDGHSRRNSHSYKQLYCVLEGDKLIFYKDKKDAALKKFCEEPPLDLVDCSVETISDYAKKKHMIKLCTNGAEHMFVVDDEEELKKWAEAMQRTEGGDTRRRSQPMIPRLSPLNSPGPSRRIPSPTQQSKKKRGSEQGTISRIMGLIRRGRGRNEEVDSSTSYLTFGQQLEECPASEDNKKVPLVVEYCIREVERNGLKAEGIYRIPGKVALINSLSADIDKGNYSQLDGGYDDIHTIGSLLKKFLKELPDPLIPSHLYADFTNAARIPDEKERIRVLKELVFNLPPVHYHTLKFLLTHLYKVSEYSDVNKMSINNLCLVFGPTIVRDTGGSNEIHAFQHGYNVIDPLLKNVKEFFHSDLCAEEEREEEEEAAREAANNRLEPERETVDGVDHTHPNSVRVPMYRSHTSLTPEGKRRFEIMGHELSPRSRDRETGASEQNLLTVTSRRGHRSSEGNIAAIKDGGSSSQWDSNQADMSSLEVTGGSLWKQQQPKRKKLSRTRQQLLTSFPPAPTGEAIQELNATDPTQSLLSVDSLRSKPQRRSMPPDTVIPNRDLVDDVPVKEVPRNQWTEKPAASSAVKQRHGSQKYSIDMYRAQSAAEGTSETRSRDRSMSMSVQLPGKIATSDGSSNSRRLPMESLL